MPVTTRPEPMPPDGPGPGPGAPGRGRTWLAALPDELAVQRRVLSVLVDRCEGWPLVMELLVGCSLGRGAADALSDIDAALGVDAPRGEAGARIVDTVEALVVAALPDLGTLVDLLRHPTGPAGGARCGNPMAGCTRHAITSGRCGRRHRAPCTRGTACRRYSTTTPGTCRQASSPRWPASMRLICAARRAPPRECSSRSATPPPAGTRPHSPRRWPPTSPGLSTASRARLPPSRGGGPTSQVCLTWPHPGVMRASCGGSGTSGTAVRGGCPGARTGFRWPSEPGLEPLEPVVIRYAAFIPISSNSRVIRKRS